MPSSRIRSFFYLSKQVVISNLLVLAMLFNTAAANALVVGDADKVLVCTSSGYQWVDTEAQQAAQVGAGHCVFCLNTQDNDDLLAWANDSCCSQAGPDANHIPSLVKTLLLSRVNPSARPRAPPESLSFS